MTEAQEYPVERLWKHIAFRNPAAFTETYGFSGSQGMVNLEGVLIRPQGHESKTLLIFMHPASTLQLLPLPNRLAALGCHVLAAGSRYQRNDTALIMENVLVDLGAYIRAAKEDWGYEKIVLCGWSGGGSLASYYQSQAENPTVTDTPAGDPADIRAAGLIPADAQMNLAAHYSRARLLAEWIDPSVRDENDPDDRDPALDLYGPGYADRRFDAEFLDTYRAAQLDRVRRITARVRDTLDTLKARGGAEVERGFVTYRTMADPRFIDTTIEPNGRKPLWTYLGHPETVNSGPVGLARFSTLRSWLSQWSIDDARADSLKCGRAITVPFLAIECGADDAVPQSHTRLIHDAMGSRDKTMHLVEGANHYFVGQPEHLNTAAGHVLDWLRARDFV
ncbi:alpha/beta hydrolase [Paracoccus sp. S-4012]|uniref:alpha/beta hydrolase family protein n=1 Tax=Paracoccus sp. S-4012 TaxID=2665648 RepID=UPI0012B01A4C|nr:alpha/beta hydrolase [Paracoccus sp. S-4012]MRX50548.1 alpha/beta hydrolase [Paracoccus sp. S-4012]